MGIVGSAAEVDSSPQRNAMRGAPLKMGAHIVVGTAGALTAADCVYDHPDITVTPNATTGRYDITFPPCIKVRPWISMVYASSTTLLWHGSVAPNATAGTWSVLFTTEAGVGAWPASTDQFDIHLECETESVQ